MSGVLNQYGFSIKGVLGIKELGKLRTHRYIVIFLTFYLFEGTGNVTPS